jgi:hypothetical protein
MSWDDRFQSLQTLFFNQTKLIYTMKQLFYLSAAALMLAFSCKKNKIDDPIDQPIDDHEEELITTMKLIFSDSAGVLPDRTFQFQDLDGPGGNNPTMFDTLFLEDSTVYNVQVEILNESVNPAENLTSEILTEADEHLFCFTPMNLSGLSIVRTDSDGTYQIGLQSKWRTIQTENGKVKIVLKHQPGVKNGSCDPGDTDIELYFEVRVK